ncbi:MAG: hypothetical protein ACK5JF_02890 [Oscillospiraceae bacterium]
MILSQLMEYALDKTNFLSVDDYSTFCENYLEYIYNNLQAVIVSKNENHYRFFQYKEDGDYNITRPINSNLYYSADTFHQARDNFKYILKNLAETSGNAEVRAIINNYIYTVQQSIGAALDGLPAGQSNFARKINGDLFERYIRLLLIEIGVPVREGTIKIPVEVDGEDLFTMSYQHDLIIEENREVHAIGSVKTSSKDRIDNIFIDKFLYNRLTDCKTPHFAVFLNDVQRKGKEPNYGVNATFLTGHFKGYTVKLNPLDGVYYCDIRPNMITDSLLSAHIKTLDHFFEDVWSFCSKPGAKKV